MRKRRETNNNFLSSKYSLNFTPYPRSSTTNYDHVPDRVDKEWVVFGCTVCVAQKLSVRRTKPPKMLCLHIKSRSFTGFRHLFITVRCFQPASVFNSFHLFCFNQLCWYNLKYTLRTKPSSLLLNATCPLVCEVFGAISLCDVVSLRWFYTMSEMNFSLTSDFICLAVCRYERLASVDTTQRMGLAECAGYK